MKGRVNPKIGVVGLGYVGLPLAIEFSRKYPTIGFDKDRNRIINLRNGIDKTLEISVDELKGAKGLEITHDVKDIASCTVYIVTVPTPVDNYNIPDMSALASASKMVGSVLNKGDVVIYESTVYPGATEEFCVPILEHKCGLKYNEDFFCGYSPERINPGDKEHGLTEIIKITSGSNAATAEFVDSLYKNIIPAGTYQASSMAVAEAAKVIENIQRDINIALVNELSIIFNKLDLDTQEILEAAGTKWNFLPFRPGLVGGHCIGVDPYYFTYKAAEIGHHPEMILAGRRINDNMGKYIADRTIAEMTKAGINPVGASVTIFGFTFKENCPDLRNTKVVDIINNLAPYGCQIKVADPYANEVESKKQYDVNLVNGDEVNKSDVIIVAVAHNQYKSMELKEWELMLKSTGVFMDVKGVVSKDIFSTTNISYWRL